jgi:protein gp37
MGQNTNIEWTDVSSNPIRVLVDGKRKGWFCTKISSGCKNCYSERMNKRFGNKLSFSKQNESRVTFVLNHKELSSWLRIKKPKRIFVCDMTDLFHPLIPFEMVQQVFWAMAEAYQHTFQVLTKRPERMAEFVQLWLSGRKRTEPLDNVWLGVSAEDQAAADERIPLLLRTPAAVRFVSAEPLLGPVVLDPHWLPDPHGPAHNIQVAWGEDTHTLDWIIAGGESGPCARPCHPDWLRQIRDQCQEAGVAFFFKQWGAWKPGQEGTEEFGPVEVGERNVWQDGHVCRMYRVGKKAAGRRLLDGRTWDEMPRRL